MPGTHTSVSSHVHRTNSGSGTKEQPPSRRLSDSRLSIASSEGSVEEIRRRATINSQSSVGYTSSVEEIRRRASIDSPNNASYTSSVEAIRQRALASNVSVVSSVEDTEISSSPEEVGVAPLSLAPNVNEEEAKISEDSEGDEFHDEFHDERVVSVIGSISTGIIEGDEEAAVEINN